MQYYLPNVKFKAIMMHCVAGRERGKERKEEDMGTRIANNGISTGLTIQLVKNTGEPDGLPIYGRYAELRGRDKGGVFSSGPPQSQDEADFPGSDDWLTLIAVADTEEKLSMILKEAAIPQLPADTSGSSRRAQIEIDVAGARKSYKNRITIASGPIIRLKPKPILDVVHVKVLPEGTVISELGPSNPLASEFLGNSITLE
jgi:hypothetical protein